MSPFVVGFVPGVLPDRWARRWSERTHRPLDLRPVAVAEQLTSLRSGEVAMCLVRDVERPDDLHLIPLYVEEPVVVVPVDHPVAAYDEIDVAELADEPRVDLPLPAALDVVAADAGVLIVPRSLARLHRRKDLTHRPVRGVPGSAVGLAWPTDAADPDLETFVGVVRGRTPRSSRGARAAGDAAVAGAGAGSGAGSGGDRRDRQERGRDRGRRRGRR